jgi:hypothetical protein
MGGLESQQQNSQYLCLDMLLRFVNDMVARAEGVSDMLFNLDYVSTDVLFTEVPAVAFGEQSYTPELFAH